MTMRALMDDTISGVVVPWNFPPGPYTTDELIQDRCGIVFDDVMQDLLDRYRHADGDTGGDDGNRRRLPMR